jgi:hypothetical protein
MAESEKAAPGTGDSALEQALFAAGPLVAYPETPDLASRVRTHLETESAASEARTSHARVSRLATGRLRQWAIAACLVLAVGASLALVPSVRSAIADWLGLRGIEIRWIEETPPPPSTPVGLELVLGRAVTLAEAQEAVDFPVLMPAAGGLPAQPEMYVSGEGADAMISFIYPVRPDLPPVDDTGVGAILTQFAGRANRSLIEKGLLGPAGAEEPQTRIVPVDVRGEPGFWITGARHAVFFVCSGVGECRQEPYRLAGDVLIWEHGGVTLRLESGLTKAAALAIAESMRPLAVQDAGTSAPSAEYGK